MSTPLPSTPITPAPDYAPQVINRSARYRNRYVHRRDSLSLANITLDEKEKLAKIGEFVVVVVVVVFRSSHLRSSSTLARFLASANLLDKAVVTDAFLSSPRQCHSSC